MEVFDAVRTVLAVRDFSGEPVPEEVLDRILEAGRLSASAMNKQPWHFVVVRDPQRIAELAKNLPTGPYVASAPVAVVVVSEKGTLPVSDCSRAVQSMILAAWAEGVGSNWVGWGKLPGVRRMLKIPDDLDILAVLPLGYPAKEVGKGKKKRKPRSEITHLEEFGRPYR